MKKIYSFFALCLTPYLGFSQTGPVIDINSIPDFGTIVNEVIDFDGGLPLYIGNGGANQVWDYSAAFVAPLNNGVMVITDPDSTPYGSYFPQATFAIDLLEIDSTWGYFLVDSTGVYWLGNYHYGAIEYDGVKYQTDTPSYITPREMFIPFPFANGSALIDTSRASISITYDTLGITSYITRISHKIKSFSGDGYGELITPNRTFPDAVRLKTLVYQIDSTITKNIFGTVVSVDTSYYNIYQWLVEVRLEFPMMMQVWMTDTTDTLVDNAYYRVQAGCGAYGLGIDTCVWAGDANADQNANHYDLLNLGLHYGDTVPPRDYITDDFLGSPADPSGDTINNGYDKYHVDCNGDGIIDSIDINAIASNFGIGHSKTSRSFTSNPANPDLYFEVITPTVAPGTDVEIKVMAGRDSVNLYGLAFEALIDTNLIQAGTLSVSWDSSWLGKQNTSMLTFAAVSSGTANVACVRNNKNDNRNKGEIARLKFKASATYNSSTVYPMSICTDGGVKSTGETQLFNCSNDTFSTGTGVGTEIAINNTVKIYPSPTKGKVNIELPDKHSSLDINIYNLLGQEVYTSKVAENTKLQYPINIQHLPVGVYIIEVTGNKLLHHSKINLVK